MKLRIGMMGSWVLGVSVLYGCAGAQPTADIGGVDTATWVAALSVNGDGSDDVLTESVEAEPVVVKGCGFEQIVETIVTRYDADQSGDLDANEQGALTSEYGDADAGVEAEHPNQGQPGKGAALLIAYDVDSSGTLETTEIAALKTDIEARCEARLGKLVEEFDADGDGTLDETEWAAARTALHGRFAEHHAGRVAEFDTNGDGQLDAEERAALRQRAHDRQAEVEMEFDVDGDGQLGDEEQSAFKEHVRACVHDDKPMVSDGRDVATEHGRADATHGRPGAPADEASAEASDTGDATPTEDTADTASDEASDSAN